MGIKLIENESGGNKRQTGLTTKHTSYLLLRKYGGIEISSWYGKQFSVGLHLEIIIY